MERLERKEHDFSAKLRQASVIGSLREYITWQRELRRSSDSARFPKYGPVSVNLDLTTACNFSCPHCVDSRLLNTGDYLDLETIKKSIDTLQKNGLRSVILIGGGEPTIHKNFENIVRFMSGRSPRECEPALMTQPGTEKCIAVAYEGVKAVAKIRDVLGPVEKKNWAPEESGPEERAMISWFGW
ncbi:MAG: radical SAM protein [Syntrophobacteraceae bacterium]|nr:radical SAM protein [Syntrophobacteraceae bacterium]